MLEQTKSAFLAGALLVAVCTATTKISGAAPAKKLDTSSPAFSNTHSDFKIAPDGSWVVYRADQDRDEVYELYCVSLTDGARSKLSGPLSGSGDVSSWQLNSTGNRAIYWANPQGNNLHEVFSAPVGGGGSVTLNRPLVDKGSTDGTVSSERVVYIASERTNVFFEPYYELFSAPAAGGPVVQLSGALANGGDVHAVFARQSGDRVLYLADQDTNDVVELYGVSLLGGPPTKLNGPLATGGNVSSQGFQFSPNGTRVIYAADQLDTRIELFSVAALGGEAVRLNGVLPNGGDVTASSLRFSPDGSRVLYHADQNADETFEVFSVAAGGGTGVRLNGPLVTNGDVRAEGLQFSPVGNRVLYTADQNKDEVYELFSVSGSGGTAVQLNGTLVEGGDVLEDAIFSPDGGRVLYRADEDTNDVIELFSVPSAGTGKLPCGNGRGALNENALELAGI
jgi:Tol biopolymer transport system component